MIFKHLRTKQFKFFPLPFVLKYAMVAVIYKRKIH